MVSRRQVFLVSALSFAFTNLSPVVPGHVLFCPIRPVHRFRDLTATEVSDLFALIHSAFPLLESSAVGSPQSMTLAVQDGEDAGQTVHHVHVHVMPRRKGDFEGDEVYRAIEEKNRKMRNLEEMAEEATALRRLFTEAE